MKRKIHYIFGFVLMAFLVTASQIENVVVKQDTKDFIDTQITTETSGEYAGKILDKHISEKIISETRGKFMALMYRCMEDINCMQKFTLEIKNYLDGIEVNLYKCDNGSPIECPFGLSGGLLTRCYQNEEKTNWFNCKTGWIKI